MTNEKIILNAVYEQLTAEQRHEIAAAVMSPEQIAALAARIIHVDKDGNEIRGTIEEAEALTAAGNVHTFDHWKKIGKSVKFGEKHIIECSLWKFTTKPSRAQREAAAEQGKEAAEHPHFYPTKSHLFSCLQVESSRPAPKGRFSSTAEIIAYNKKLAAERKAKAAAEKAAAETAAPVVAVEEHHELPVLVHAEPLPTKKAVKKPRSTKAAPDAVKKAEQAARDAMNRFIAVPETDRAGQAAALAEWRTARTAVEEAKKQPAAGVNIDDLKAAFSKHYSRLYQTDDDHESGEYLDAVDRFDELSENDPQFTATVQKFNESRGDLISSDREAAAFVMALDELERQKMPEMVPSVQQLDFESIAANLLA